MNKLIRMLLVLAAVVGVLALASTRISWAARPAAEAQAPSAPEATSAPVLEPAPAAALAATSTAAPQPTTAAPSISAAAVVSEVEAAASPLTDELRGTVRPPGCRGIHILSVGQYSGGEYSICGMAIAKVILKREGLEVELRLQNHTTKGAGNVIVGTIELTVRLDKKKVDGPHDPYADIQLCYAVPPGKEVEVKFYDTEKNAWVALETTVGDGQACATANFSGDYVLVKK
jgi:hypothetical protein